MNRKFVGGSIVLVLAAVAVWFFGLRGNESKQPTAGTGSARSAAIKPATQAPPSQPDEAAPRGLAPKWSLDIDREGPLLLEGQVVGPDGAGLGDADVWLGSVPPRTTKTEADGTFSFDKLVGRTYAVSARSGALIGGPITYKLTSSSDPVVLRLAEGAAVLVTVVDEAKQPLAEVELSAGSTIEGKAKTDAKGEAKLAPVSPGYVWVEATAKGYAAGGGMTTVGSAGATGRLTITLRRGFAVSGRVIDDAGKPVAKARVSLGAGAWTAQDGEEPRPNTATTDDRGRFSLDAVAAGSHELHAFDGEHAPARSASPVTVADRDVSGVEIIMKAGGVLAGSVVDVKQQPVPYATVRVVTAGTGMQQFTGARQVTADVKGLFEIRGLARDKLHVRAESELAASKLETVDLGTQPDRKDLELVLDVTGTISGIVVDGSGAPVPEVQVSAFPDILGGASMDGIMLASMSPATTDGAGAFTITGVPEGAYKLWAARSSNASYGWGKQNTSAKTGDKDVRITLASPGGLEGTIVVDGGGAPKLATVGIGWQAPTPAQDGAFEVKELEPGSYDVIIRGPEFAVTTLRDIKVEAGKVTDLGAVTVHRGRRVTGKVVDNKGRPVAGATIKLGEMLVFSDEEQPGDNDDMMENMGVIRSATSDQDGAFSIIGAPAKATTVAADHPTAGRSISHAILEGKQDPPPVTLALRGFGTISGRVIQKGKPLADVAVTQSSKSGGAQFSGAKTDAQGNFTMKKVPEGPIVLQAMQQKMMSFKNTSVTVQVTAGKDTKVTIDIPVGQVTLAVDLKPAAGQQVDAAQVFLFTGTALPANGKQLMDSFIAGGGQGMKFWFGAGKPIPEFEELVPGDYSICSIPITGDMNEPKFMQRLNENVATLAVYCKKATVKPAPLKQTVPQELPAMTPLPAP